MTATAKKSSVIKAGAVIGKRDSAWLELAVKSRSRRFDSLVLCLPVSGAKQSLWVTRACFPARYGRIGGDKYHRTSVGRSCCIWFLMGLRQNIPVKITVRPSCLVLSGQSDDHQPVLPLADIARPAIKLNSLHPLDPDPALVVLARLSDGVKSLWPS